MKIVLPQHSPLLHIEVLWKPKGIRGFIMIRKFINFLGIATSVAILASCSGATENLEDNQVETKQETRSQNRNG